VALEERLAQRRPLGFRGAEPNMTVQELGEDWMRRPGRRLGPLLPGNGAVRTGRGVVSRGLHRQPMTKTGAARTIALPCANVEMLNRRRAALRQHDRQPLFAHACGGWLWPNNVRSKLRGVVAGTSLVGTSRHTLRRTVGTLVAHSVGLDAARDVLGHRDPSVTARHYVPDSGRVVDVRNALDPILA
jgi:integrase